MSAHLSQQEQTFLISRVLEQGPPARQLVEVFVHLAECGACRETVNELRNRNMQLSDILEWTPAHLEFQQLAGYVAGQLDEIEREIAANHLAVCDFCTHEIQALTLLQRELVNTNASNPQPVSLTWWTHLKASWQNGATFKHEALWAPALVLTTVVLLTALGAWWWKRMPIETANIRPEMPVSPPTLVTPDHTVPAQPLTNDTGSLLAINDHGQQIALRQDGGLISTLTLPVAYQEMLIATLTHQRLALPPVLKSLAQSSRTLKSGEPETASFAVLAPIGVVLQTDRPLFRWQPVAGATGYVVAIFDEEFKPIQASETLMQTQWRAAQALPRGRILLWQVTAHIGDKQITAPAAPVPEARFQLVPYKQSTELQRAQREFTKSHLLLGTLYAQAGLLAEASHEFQALQAENPQSPLIKKLLQQLRQSP